MALAGLVLGLGGAVFGGVVGGPTGAQIGFLAGSLLGTVLFPEKTKGPRLDDLKVMTSGYGLNVKVIFGTLRTAGNVFWAEDIEEDVDSRRTGLFGPKVKEYKYFLTFAVGICEGPMDAVLRIWANGDLIYDKRAGERAIKLKGLSFTFYPGSETQAVDPLIDAEVTARLGAGYTPAYRGLCYIVFNRFPLAEYSNQVPNIEIEIAQSTSEAAPGTLVDTGTTLPGGALTTALNTFFAVDWNRQYAYAADTTGTISTTGVRRINLETMEEDRQMTSENALVQTLDGGTCVPRGPVCCLPSGRLLMQIGTATGTNREPWVVLDGTALRETARWGAADASLNFSQNGFALCEQVAAFGAYGQEGLQDWAICRSTNGQFGILYASPRGAFGADSGALAGIWNSDQHLPDEVITEVWSVAGGRATPGYGECYAITGPTYAAPSSTAIKLWRIRVPAAPPPEDTWFTILAAATNPATGILASMQKSITTFSKSKVVTLTVADLVPGETTLDQAGKQMVWDEADNTVMFHVRATSDGQDYIVKVDPADGDVLWRAPVANAPDDRGTWNASRVQNDRFGYVATTGRGTLIDTRTGEVLVDNVDFGVTLATGALGAYDSRLDQFVGRAASDSFVWARYYFSATSSAPVPVSDIITAICARCGLESTDIDVTDLTDDTVFGYGLSNQTTGREAISPLALGYFFDGVESDHLLKFVERGAAAVRTIDTEDMIPDSQGYKLTESRTQDVELPVRLSISYFDIARDYDVGTQSRRRIIEPSPAAYGENQTELQFPVATTATFAKRITDKALYATWSERRAYGGRLPWKHLDLDPTDVITITHETETLERVRLSDVDTSNRLEIEIGALRETPGQYTSAIDADAGTFENPGEGSTLTHLILLDSPLLNDVDEQRARGGAPLYYLMGGYGAPGWRAGALYASDEFNLSSFDIAGRVTTEMTWGVTINALGDPASPHATDEDNDLIVRLTTGGPLVSITQAAMLAGGNRAALVKLNGEVEVIRFRDVTANADGTYTLAGILRGRRGTDTMAYGHEPGETFVLIPDDGENVYTDYVPIPVANLNSYRFYRGVGDRQFFEDSELTAHSHLLRGLMPYAPENIHAYYGASNSVDITWVRRDRLGADIILDDFGGDVELNEDSEEYEIEIYDAPGGTLVRTVTGLTTPTWNYSSANQATDGFTAPVASLTLKVFQISQDLRGTDPSPAGRGFARERTVDTETP